MPDASPTKWHRAHVTWFFETFVLNPHEPGYEAFDPDFAFLFNSYYETVGPRHTRAERGMITRPGVDRITAYREHVDDAIETFLATGCDSDVCDLIELGLHHEQQHQELIVMDIKHLLAQNPAAPAYHEVVDAPGVMTPATFRAFEGGIVEIGHEASGFGFDNEGPRHEVLLRPFEVADRLVTCGEWLDFIDDGGYRSPAHWLSDGWHTAQDQGWEAPEYWYRIDGEWMVFTLSGLRPIDRAAPVCHLSYYEADAFASWSGARLPTEAEWEAAAMTAGDADPRSESLHPLAAGPSTSGLRQTFGSVWQWTSSPYVAYPGFRAAPGAVGEYNGKFMVNTWVLRGGCVATLRGHVRASYRNFFHPRTRWHFSGVRLARDPV